MVKELDDLDLQLLKILEKNAKARIHVIAKKMGIPASTVHHRIKRMEKDGIIEKWTIKKNHELMGLKVKSYILVFVNVTTLKGLGKTQKDVADEIRGFENIEAVDIIAGDADILVTTRCTDLKSLQNVLLDRIQSIEGITKTKTMIAIGEK